MNEKISKYVFENKSIQTIKTDLIRENISTSLKKGTLFKSKGLVNYNH